MKDLTYSISFHAQWHCGSGLSAGADVDALVIKDKDSLPYVPGKTIKGLIREAVEDLLFFTGSPDDKLVRKVFGHISAENEKEISKGEAFFTNAELNHDEKTYILCNNLVKFLYLTKAATEINNKGVAEDHSLRRIETTVPCTLYGKILNVDDDMTSLMTKAAGLIKRIGVNRNRGLGRCTFKIWEDEK